MNSHGDSAITSVVVDVGNSRLKWGRCDGQRIVDAAALPLSDPAAWEAQWDRWRIERELSWTIAGVNPPVIDQLIQWLQARRSLVRRLDDFRELALQISVEAPEQVGIDRLLKAVAANSRRPEGRGAIIIDTGSAVTVDWIDEAGTFRGGTIFPGLQLMARALAAFTAKLPQVTVTEPPPEMLGTSTTRAIHAGLFAAVLGGIERIVADLQNRAAKPPCIFLAGGDATLLARALKGNIEHWPHMTLEGIRLTVARDP
jgi:type III pantothenate kinase